MRLRATLRRNGINTDGIGLPSAGGYRHRAAKLVLAKRSTIPRTWRQPVPCKRKLFGRLLSLCFKRGSFARGGKAVAKRRKAGIPMSSGGLLDGRIAPRPARTAALRPPRRPAARFRRLRGRAQLRQKCRNGATNPDRHQAAGTVARRSQGSLRSATHGPPRRRNGAKAATTTSHVVHRSACSPGA